MDKIDRYIKNRATGLDNIDSLCYILNIILQYRLFDTKSNISINDLNQYSNTTDDTRYLTFKIPKKRSGEYRVIQAPNDRLKSILRAINILLGAIYESKPYVTGFVSGSSVVSNAALHTKQRFVFNLDLHNFFGTIYFDNVVNRLKAYPYNYSTDVAKIIVGLSSVKDPISGAITLAQGSPASPILSNIMCESMDYQLYGLSQRYKVAYSRYADDITFSGMKNIYNYNDKFIRRINSIIERHNFVVNFSKVRLQHKDIRQVVTGLIVNNKVNVPRTYVKDLRNILYIWERYGYESAYKCFAKHYNKTNLKTNNTPSIICYLQGKLGYLKLVKGERDSTYQKLAHRLKNLLSFTHNNFKTATISDFKSFITITQLTDFSWDNPQNDIYGTMYYNSPKGVIVVSPIVKKLISNSNSIYNVLELYCCVHKIYDKDGVKWLISLRRDKSNGCNISCITQKSPMNSIVNNQDINLPKKDQNLIDKPQGIIFTIKEFKTCCNNRPLLFQESPNLYFCAICTMEFDGPDFAGPPISDLVRIHYKGKVSIALAYSLNSGGADKTGDEALSAVKYWGICEDSEIFLLNKDTGVIRKITSYHSTMNMLFLLSTDTKIE